MRVSPSMPTSVVRAMLRLTLLGAAVLLLVVRVENKEVDKFIPLGGESKIPVLGYGTYGVTNTSRKMVKMEYFNLSDGRKIPAVGYGTFEALDADLEKALNEALEAGYRLIDTATLYNNEKVIGKVINEWISAGKLKREDLFVTTKLPPIGMRREDVSTFVKISLDNLKLDYIDLYLIHCPFGLHNVDVNNMRPLKPDGSGDFDPNTNHVEIWKGMEEAVDAGLVKSIGVSNFNIRQLTRVLENSRIKPANHQFEFHAYYQNPDVVKFCKEKGLSMTSYSTLGCPGYAAFMAKFGEKIDIPDIMDTAIVKSIAKKHDKTPAQVLLRHAIQTGLNVIPKSVTPSRIISNIDLFGFKLDDEDMKSINALDRGPKAKIVDFSLFPGVEKHPEYPL